MGIRLNKILTQLNVSTETVVEFLKSKPGLEPTKTMNPNTKVTDEQYAALLKEFNGDKRLKEKADTIFPVTSREHKPSLRIIDGVRNDIKIVGKIDLDSINQSTRPKKKTKEEKEAERRAKRAEWLSRTQELPTSQEVSQTSVGNSVNYNSSNKEFKIRLSQLRFEDDRISYSKGNKKYVFLYDGFPSYLNSDKNHSLIKGINTTIYLDETNQTFCFTDKNTLKLLKQFKKEIEKNRTEKHLFEIERKKQRKRK